MIPNMYGYKSLQIAKLAITETGTYNQQFRRPFQTVLSPESQNRILEAVDQSKVITPAGLATVASSFVAPSATPESQVQIAHGWQEPRFRFLLEVVSQDRTGMCNTTEYITGYTDHPGVGYGGSLDPNMVFFVNGVNTMRQMLQRTPLGQQVHQNLVDASQILVNRDYTGLTGPNHMYGLRPEDVYDQIDNVELGETLHDGFLADGRTKITAGATKSKRSNAVAPVYMANVLDSYLQSSRVQRDDSSMVILEVARHSVESDPIVDDPFMNYVRNLGTAMGGNAFTLGDLMRLDSNVMNVIQRPELSNALRGTLHQAGLTQGWGGSDYQTLFATTLAQSMPSYMVQFGINKIRLLSTNQAQGGQITTQVVDSKTFQTGMDMASSIAALTHRFNTELLKNLTQNNMISYQLDLTVDMLGDTTVEVSVNGSPMTPFVMPSFADALMAPVMTGNYDVLSSNAGDFHTLMTQITENDFASGANGIMRTGLI